MIRSADDYAAPYYGVAKRKKYAWGRNPYEAEEEIPYTSPERGGAAAGGGGVGYDATRTGARIATAPSGLRNDDSYAPAPSASYSGDPYIDAAIRAHQRETGTTAAADPGDVYRIPTGARGGGRGYGGATHVSGKIPSDRDALDEQRRRTNRAFRTANAFLPLEAAASEAWDDYFRLYDEATREDEALQALGGTAARELPVTLPKSFLAGGAKALRALANEAGFLAQRGAEAELEQTAEMWRRLGLEDRAQEMEAVRDALNGERYERWAGDFGKTYVEAAQRKASGYGKVGRLLSDVAESAGNMLPSMVANAAAPGSGLPTLFLQASGSATEEALEKGATKENALLYGAAVGTVEALTEKLTGGIPALGVGALDATAEQAIKRALQSPAAQTAALSLVKSLGEGVEEFVSEFADAWIYRQLVNGEDRSWKEVAHDAWYSALVGALTSAGLNAAASAGKSAKALAKTLVDETARRVDIAENTPETKTAAPEAEAAAVHAGEATTIRHPYQGAVPEQKVYSGRSVTVPETSLSFANTLTAQARAAEAQGVGRFKTLLTRLYQQAFQRSTGVPVEGMDFEGKPYLVDIGSQVPGKVISDPYLSTEKLALLDVLPAVVQNGRYVGSGEYIPHGSKSKPVVRYDYFETPATIGETSYIVRFDVEVIPGTNNYRTHQIVNVDLIAP